jgi:hypothetical protein
MTINLFQALLYVVFAFSGVVAAENELQSFKPLVSLLHQSTELERYLASAAEEIFQGIAPDNKKLQTYQKEMTRFDNHGFFFQINTVREKYSGEELAYRLRQIYENLDRMYTLKKEVIPTILHNQIRENNKFIYRLFNKIFKATIDVKLFLYSSMFDSPGEFDFEFECESYIKRSLQIYQKELQVMERASINARVKMGGSMRGANQKEGERKVIPYDVFFVFES